MIAVERCRTNALGGHVDECDVCGHIEISYNSCRNRNCAKCRGSQRGAWVDARELELLPIQYFHIVFTLSDCLLGPARFNPVTMYNLLFRVAAETLQAFADRCDSHPLWTNQCDKTRPHEARFPSTNPSQVPDALLTRPTKTAETPQQPRPHPTKMFGS